MPKSINNSIIITIVKIHTCKFFINLFSGFTKNSTNLLANSQGIYNNKESAILFLSVSISRTLTLTCSLTLTTSAGSLTKRLAI